MSSAAGLLLVAGAVYGAHQLGYLDAFGIGAESAETATETPAPVASAQVTQKSDAPVVALDAGSKERTFLVQNWRHVSNFSADNMALTEAIMWTESGHLKGVNQIKAKSNAGALGLMQVLPGTAEWMRGEGYRKLQPTAAVLHTAAGSIYFGTAYLEFLEKHRRGRGVEWMIRSYNGGPGKSLNTSEPHHFDGGGKHAENDTHLRKTLERMRLIEQREQSLKGI